jgi:hypothetical protein
MTYARLWKHRDDFYPFPIIPMSKGKPLGTCKTCGSEIVETVNDGVFRQGECDACERIRYESQPALLEACYAAMELRCPEDDDYECYTLILIRDALAKAEGRA